MVIHAAFFLELYILMEQSYEEQLYEILHIYSGLLLFWHCIYCRWNNCMRLYTFIQGLVQDCSMSSVLAMEIPQSCTKPLVDEFINILQLWVA